MPKCPHVTLFSTAEDGTLVKVRRYLQDELWDASLHWEGQWEPDCLAILSPSFLQRGHDHKASKSDPNQTIYAHCARAALEASPWLL